MKNHIQSLIKDRQVVSIKNFADSNDSPVSVELSKHTNSPQTSAIFFKLE